MDGSPPGSPSRQAPFTPGSSYRRGNFTPRGYQSKVLAKHRSGIAPKTQPTKRKVQNAYLDIREQTVNNRFAKATPNPALASRVPPDPRAMFGGTPSVNRSRAFPAPATVQPAGRKSPSTYDAIQVLLNEKKNAAGGSPSVSSQIVYSNASNVFGSPHAERPRVLRTLSPPSPVPGDYPEEDGAIGKAPKLTPQVAAPLTSASMTETLRDRFQQLKNKFRGSRAAAAQIAPVPDHTTASIQEPVPARASKPTRTPPSTRFEPYTNASAMRRKSPKTPAVTKPSVITNKSPANASPVNHTADSRDQVRRFTTEEVQTRSDDILERIRKRRSAVADVLSENRSAARDIERMTRKDAIRERVAEEDRVRRDQILGQIESNVPLQPVQARGTNGSSSFLTEDTIPDPPVEAPIPTIPQTEHGEQEVEQTTDDESDSFEEPIPMKPVSIPQNVISLDSDSEEERVYGTGSAPQPTARQLDAKMDASSGDELESYIESDSEMQEMEDNGPLASDRQYDNDVEVDMIDSDADSNPASDESSGYGSEVDETFGSTADADSGEDTASIINIPDSDDTTSHLSHASGDRFTDIPEVAEHIGPARQAVEIVVSEDFISLEADYEEVPTEKDESEDEDDRPAQESDQEISKHEVRSTIKDTVQETVQDTIRDTVNDSGMDSTVVLEATAPNSLNTGETTAPDLPTVVTIPDEIEELPDFEDEYPEEEEMRTPRPRTSITPLSPISVSPSGSSYDSSLSIDRNIANPLDIITENGYCYNRHGRRIGCIDYEGYVEADVDGLVCGFMENDVFSRVVPCIDHENPENTTRDLTKDEEDGPRRPNDKRDIDVSRDSDDFVEEEEQEGIELHKGEHITPFAKKTHLFATGGKDKSNYDTPQFKTLFSDAKTPLGEGDDTEELESEEEEGSDDESIEELSSPPKEKFPKGHVAPFANKKHLHATGGKDKSYYDTPQFKKLYPDAETPLGKEDEADDAESEQEEKEEDPNKSMEGAPGPSSEEELPDDEEMSDSSEPGESDADDDARTKAYTPATRKPSTSGKDHSRLFSRYQPIHDVDTNTTPDHHIIPFDQGILDSVLGPRVLSPSPVKTMVNEEISKRLMMSPDGKLAIRVNDEDKDTAELADPITSKQDDTEEEMSDEGELSDVSDASEDREPVRAMHIVEYEETIEVESIDPAVATDAGDPIKPSETIDYEGSIESQESPDVGEHVEVETIVTEERVEEEPTAEKAIEPSREADAKESNDTQSEGFQETLIVETTVVEETIEASTVAEVASGSGIPGEPSEKADLEATTDERPTDDQETVEVQETIVVEATVVERTIDESREAEVASGSETPVEPSEKAASEEPTETESTEIQEILVETLETEETEVDAREAGMPNEIESPAEYEDGDVQESNGEDVVKPENETEDVPQETDALESADTPEQSDEKDGVPPQDATISKEDQQQETTSLKADTEPNDEEIKKDSDIRSIRSQSSKLSDLPDDFEEKWLSEHGGSERSFGLQPGPSPDLFDSDADSELDEAEIYKELEGSTPQPEPSEVAEEENHQEKGSTPEPEQSEVGEDIPPPSTEQQEEPKAPDTLHPPPIVMIPPTPAPPGENRRISLDELQLHVELASHEETKRSRGSKRKRNDDEGETSTNTSGSRYNLRSRSTTPMPEPPKRKARSRTTTPEPEPEPAKKKLRSRSTNPMPPAVEPPTPAKKKLRARSTTPIPPPEPQPAPLKTPRKRKAETEPQEPTRRSARIKCTK